MSDARPLAVCGLRGTSPPSHHQLLLRLPESALTSFQPDLSTLQEELQAEVEVMKGELARQQVRHDGIVRLCRPPRVSPPSEAVKAVHPAQRPLEMPCVRLHIALT